MESCRSSVEADKGCLFAEGEIWLEVMYYIYVLYSNSLKKRYVGFTKNVSRRLVEHNRGESQFTKGGIPWKLVYFEELGTQQLARSREVFLKSGSGRKWLDENITF